MSKKIIAMLTALVMVLGCTGALAENTKHERVYVVAGADGTVKSITDSVRLENTDGLDELADRTMLTAIHNVGGNETFTLEGETLTWKADGKNVIYQGTSEKAPVMLPVVTLTLDGEEISAADLKEKTGEAVLTVTYRTEGLAPTLVLSVLPIPEEGISGLKTENAAVLTEAGRSVLVGWAVPNMDASLQLPESFSATFHADHADLGWMMTFCSSDPLEAACREIDARIGDSDPEALLKETAALLTALKDGTDLPRTEGKTKEIVDRIRSGEIAAEQMVRDAQQKAQEIIKKAEEEAQQLRIRDNEETQELRRGAMKELSEKSEKELLTAAESAGREIEELTQAARARMPEAVEAVLSMLAE